jgi:L-lactate dehydrogenase complex protein LldG
MEAMSRASIIAAIKANKPESRAFQEISDFESYEETSLYEVFVRQAEFIGAKVVLVKSYDDILAYVKEHFKSTDRIVSTIAALSSSIPPIDLAHLAHLFSDLELAILPAHFAVAENGAVWLTQDQMGQRIVPFICQHLAVVLSKRNIVKDMHAAYGYMEHIAFEFGAFIAGPSKTADIEQSLIIGAHGARSMLIFILDEEL